MAKKEKDAAAVEAPDVPVLALGDHARAQQSIGRLKALGGVAGLILGVLLSLRAGVPLPDALGRGVLLGLGLWLAVWVTAVVVWRQIAQAELEAARRRLLASLDALDGGRGEAGS